MKRFLSALIILTLVLALFGCETAGEDDIVGGGDVEFSEGSDSDVVDKDKLPSFKIAFSYATFTDKLGSQFRQSLQYLADAFNVEMVFFESASGDEAITALESILAAGDIDGVIQVGTTPAQVAAANKYGVPYIAVCGFPSLDEEVKGVAEFDNFLGGIIDDDVWAGERCIEALYEAGCRNICYAGLTQGFVKSHDDRMKAMLRVVDSHDDMNLLADSYTMGEWANDVASFNAAFPEMDGIGFSAMLDAIYLAMESENIADGSVKISAVDISSQTGEYFKKGVQVWTCGGQYGTAMVGWTILYNYLLDGTVIIEDTSKPLIRPYIEVKSYEDYENYVKYVESPLPVYNVDEISELIHYFNADVTLADFLKLADDYSLEDIIARHGDQIE